MITAIHPNVWQHFLRPHILNQHQHLSQSIKVYYHTTTKYPSCLSRMRPTFRGFYGPRMPKFRSSQEGGRGACLWLGYILLHLHGAIASTGKYDGSSRASRPTASGARTPERQRHGCRDEDDTTKDTPNNCHDLSCFVAVTFLH